jgi:predicted metalloprotease with PDZ domain
MSIRLCRHAVILGLAAASALVTLPTVAQPLPALRTTPYPGTITLQVDATDLDHKVFKVRETLPVQAGPLTLYYPRWLPGNHGPTGSVSKLAGLQMSTGGKPLAWKRNTLDSHAFHVDIPAGAKQLDLEFSYLSNLDKANGRVMVTPEILGLQWNTVLLYPAGHAVSAIRVEPSLTLPEGWGLGTALVRSSGAGGSTVGFAPTTVETLVDSPVFAGRHFQQLDLDPGAREAGRAPVFLNIVSDQPSQARVSPEQLAAHRALVTQADKVFGARRYARYDFLLALSEDFGRIGLEHHQSSENAVRPGYFNDWQKTPVGRDLLPHEYTHSWNGKFRRPADLWTPHFNTPMQGSLLWVYEGQTEYWGKVLAARSGLWTLAETRDALAYDAAWLDARAGRAWRNLQDTTNEPVLNAQSGQARDWRDVQRSADYYDEGTLLWLDVDMLIREKSNGQRSLDDFARGFFGGAEPGRAPHDIRPSLYTFDDVVRELQRVQPHDWPTFLRERLDSHGPGAPLGGLERAGWKLAFSEQPSEHFKGREARDENADFSFSLGLTIARDGRLSRVAWDSPAFQAGLTSQGTLLAVNGRAYKAERLREAVTMAKAGDGRIELLVRTGDVYKTAVLQWRGGLRYPKLERIEGREDRLTPLLSARP